MTRSSTRRGWGRRPSLEGLEARALLSTASAASRAAAVQGSATSSDKQFSYTTPQGTHVVITLYGVGSLAGTNLGPGDALNLVYGGTNEDTGIVAKVTGGNGHAPLQSIESATLPADDLSGIGATVLNVVNLKNFDLVDGGRINLTAGVHSLFLDSVGQDTQINLRELAESFTQGSSSSVTTNTLNGITETFSDDSSGARTLTSVSGTYTAPTSLPNTTTYVGTAQNPGPNPGPPGVIVDITHIRGPARSQSGLGDPMVFGYDPATNSLIRFDVISGQQTMTIPLAAGQGTLTAGATLARDDGQLVVLAGNGTTIQAFNAVTGAAVGSFSVANLESEGLTTIDGLGSTGTETVLSSSQAGLLQAIDVTASLASADHEAVPIGAPYAPTRQFDLAGGLTGVAGSDTIYAAGAAHFDSFQPDQTQVGIMALSTSNGQLAEQSRAALRNSSGQTINNGASGTASSQPYRALGSVDQNLALVTNVANGVNTVTLYNPQNLAITGTVTLDDANPLTGLSESFRPDLQGAALVDVQGNVQSLRANDAEGLVFNTTGYVGLAKIGDAVDTTISALPFGHAIMPRRSNVAIISSSRPVNNRNGVTTVKNLEAAGPLSLP